MGLPVLSLIGLASAITKLSSYRERLMALMDSFIDVIDQALADGLKVIDGTKFLGRTLGARKSGNLGHL